MSAAPIAIIAAPTSYIPLALPPTMRGCAKYAVVLRPADGQAFCLGFKHICESAGAQLLLQRIVEKRNGHYRKPVQGVLCDCALQGKMCPLGVGCPNIHCTPAGVKAMRPWSTTPPVKEPKKLPEVSRESSQDSADEAGALSSEDASDTASDRAGGSQGSAAAAGPVPPASPPSTAVFSAPRPTPLLLHPVALWQSSIRLRQWMQRLDGQPHTDPPTPPSPVSPTVHEPYSPTRVL